MAGRRRRVEEKSITLNIENKLLSDLGDHPRNEEIRKHPNEGTPEWKALHASLEDDYFDPLVWNSRNGKLVSGHLRKKVMTSMGVSSADVVVVDYPEDKHLARMIAANQPVGQDNLPGLADVLAEFNEAEDFDIQLTGMSLGSAEDIISGISGGGGEGSEEEEQENASGDTRSLPDSVMQVITEKIQPDVEVALGEVWELGEHTLYCRSMISGDRDWAARLVDEPDLTFIPLPDPYSIVNPDHPTSILVQPDPFVASMIVSNYGRVHGEESIHKIEE